MADSATTRKRLRKQSLGSNTNTWGDTKLNEILDVLDQIVDGYQTIALTGDVTLTTTNYTTADQAKYRFIKFTGTLAASAAVTFPNVEGWYFIYNAAGAAVTCKLSASTGVTLQNGDRALIFSNATDFENAAPTIFPNQTITFAAALTLAGAITMGGQLHGMVAGSANTDGVNVAQLAAAIAASVPLGTAGTVLNSITDTTRDFHAAKTVENGDSNLIVQTNNAGGNETRAFSTRRIELEAFFLGSS